jgi:hypothetical protein
VADDEEPAAVLSLQIWSITSVTSAHVVSINTLEYIGSATRTCSIRIRTALNNAESRVGLDGVEACRALAGIVRSITSRGCDGCCEAGDAAGWDL